jgi:hypothetical protein
MRHRFRELMALLLGLTLAPLGCTTTGPGSKPRVDELNLVAMPVAVGVGSRANNDGIALKVYAVDNELPKTQPIRSGNLDFLLFDGLQREGFSETNRALRVWSFRPAELAGRVFTSTVGTWYFFTLSWGQDRPQANTITVIARYRPPQGPALYSAPCFIELPPPVPVAPGPSAPAMPGPTAPPAPGSPGPVAPGK